MLEKIKYRLSDPDFIRQTRVRCIAAMTAFIIAVITLLGFSLNTVKVFDGEKTYTVKVGALPDNENKGGKPPYNG